MNIFFNIYRITQYIELLYYIKYIMHKKIINLKMGQVEPSRGLNLKNRVQLVFQTSLNFFYLNSFISNIFTQILSITNLWACVCNWEELK